MTCKVNSCIHLCFLFRVHRNMVLVERNTENGRNGRRSRGPSPNGQQGGTPETSSDDDCKHTSIESPFAKLMNPSRAATKKIGTKSTKAKSEYEEKIRVGRDFQVQCPDLVPVPERKPDTLQDRALLVWSPTVDIPETKRKWQQEADTVDPPAKLFAAHVLIDDTQEPNRDVKPPTVVSVEDYINVAKQRYGYNGEQALGMLFWHKHDLERAVQDLSNFTPFPDEWSVEDKVLFEQAFQFHGKSFHRIRQMVNIYISIYLNSCVQDLVEYTAIENRSNFTCLLLINIVLPYSYPTKPLPVWSNTTTHGKRQGVAPASSIVNKKNLK